MPSVPGPHECLSDEPQATSFPQQLRQNDHQDPARFPTTSRRQRAAVLPSVPATPAPSRASPDAPDVPVTSSHTSVGHQEVNLSGLPPPTSPQAATGPKRHRDLSTPLTPSTLDQAPKLQPCFEIISNPTSGLHDNHGSSLSDFSRPGSSQFSRCTSLASRRSRALSAGMSDNGPDENTSPHCLCTPVGSLPSPGTLSKSALSMEPDNHEVWPRPTYEFSPQLDVAESSSPIAQKGPKEAALSPEQAWSDSVLPHWPVLPPISPFRDIGEMRGSSSTHLSPTHSEDFDELDALVPCTGSVLSQELSDTGPEHSSPETDLTQRTASLDLGCIPNDAASLSRVRLLLLDNYTPTEDPSPLGAEWYHSNNESGVEMAAGLGVGVAPEGHDYRALATGEAHTAGDASSDLPEPIHSWPLSVFSSEEALACSPVDSSPCHQSPEDKEPCVDLGLGTEAGGLGQRTGSGREGHSRQTDRQVDTERTARAMHIYSRLQEDGLSSPRSGHCQDHSRFEDFEFLAKYCIFSQEKLAAYKRTFEGADTDGDGYLTCFQVLLALKEIVPPEVLSDDEEVYVYRILELVDFRMADGLTDLRLFAVIASLAQKVAALDDFMRSLIGELDFGSLEMKLRKAKQLFLFLVEARCGVISVEDLLLELKAGGIREEHEETVRAELRHVSSFDLLDFLAHLPLFILIHNSVVTNPLDDSRNL